MRIEIYQRERHREAWEEFVERRARNAHFMHTRRYSDYHGDRFEDHSLLVFGEKATPLALLPAVRQATVLASHPGLSFGGLLVGGRFRLNEWREAFAAIGEHMLDEGFEQLDYRPTPPWFHLQPGEEDVFLIESAGVPAELLGSAICRMDGHFLGDTTRRRNSRVEVEVAREDESLGEMMELVGLTLQERHETAPVHTREEMELLSGRFPDGIRCYTARAAGRLVAGVVLYCSAAAVKLQYVGYSDGRATSAVFAHLFSLEEFRGRWFDFGTSMAGRGLDPGLFAYKESLGGRLAPVRRYLLAAGSPPLIQC
jgi:hypothetical protein